ncbi:MAG: hypothetical protein WCL16_00465 [bacterium]
MHAAWILTLTWAVLSGWLLSLLDGLSLSGYALACLPFFAWMIFNRRGALTGLAREICRHMRRFAQRGIRRPLPALFALTALATALGGILYAPNNYDFLTYRFARMLQWWDAGHWYWIHTVNMRQNTSGSGMEWTMMPLLLLARSSRLFSLLNVVAYLFMPGLVFSVLTQLGIQRRTSWFWMWIIPAGYCYAATAGGGGNDAFGAVLALAAMHFACRAVRDSSITAFWLGCLAAGLMTGVKASNLPLVLPVMVAAAPAWKLIKAHCLKTSGVVCVALAVSIAPIAIMNQAHTGDWSGDPCNHLKLKATATLPALIGNGLQLAAGCLAPPVFPLASAWNAHADKFLPIWIRKQLADGFPRFSLRIGELGNEEHVGLGCGVTILLLSSAIFAVARRPRSRPQTRRWAVLMAGAAALFAYCSLLVSESTARLLTPYYTLALACVLALPGCADVTRTRWWQKLAVLMSVMALAITMLTPSRPLWPAQSVTQACHSWAPGNRLFARIATVYSVYQARSDALAPARKLLPPGTRVIGFIQTGDDPEIALWQPLGHRRVVDMIGPEIMNRQWLDRTGIQAIVARREIVEKQSGSVEKWLAVIDGRMIATVRLTIKVAEGEREWCVVMLNPRIALVQAPGTENK